MSARRNNSLWIGRVFGTAKRVLITVTSVLAVMLGITAATPVQAEGQSEDVLMPVSSMEDIRQLTFKFDGSDRVFLTNVTFGIIGKELVIAKRDSVCGDTTGSKDLSAEVDFIIEDTNDLPRPVEIVVGSARLEIDGFTLAEREGRTPLVTSLRGRKPTGELFEWTRSGRDALCKVVLVGTCWDKACTTSCGIDWPDCDPCHCFSTGFCVNTAHFDCEDIGCRPPSTNFCLFVESVCDCGCFGGSRQVGCCLNGLCSEMTAEECATLGGNMGDEGETCEGVECFPAYVTGACCIYGGTDCVEASAEECADLNGVYHGDGSFCDPNPCVPGEPGPYFYIGTETDWYAAMDAGKIEGMTQTEWDDYMVGWATPEEGDPYIENTFFDPYLYVYTGGPAQEEYPKGTALVMAWYPPPGPPTCCQCFLCPPPDEFRCADGFEDEWECADWCTFEGCPMWEYFENAICDWPNCVDLPPPEPISASSAWKYALGSTHEGRPPPPPVDLSNKLVTITVGPPQFDLTGNQINVVSFGFQDVNGNHRAWYWNVGPVPPNTIPWSIPPSWTTTTITINTAMTSVGAATPTADSYMDNGFLIAQSQYVVVDENANWVGGPNPIPPPLGTGGAWNYWYNLSIAPSGGGGGPSTHGPVSFSVNGPMDPYYEGLPIPGSPLFTPPWWPPPPPGAGPYPSARTLSVPQAVGIPAAAAVWVGDVNDYFLVGVPSEGEIFQSEPPLNPAGPPNFNNNQILKDVSLGLSSVYGHANVNAYTFGEDFFNGDEDPQCDPDLYIGDELWEYREDLMGFNEPVVAGGGLPITFYFSVDPWAIGLPGTAVQNEATWQGALFLPPGPPGSADVGGVLGPWDSDGEASGDVFFASPITAPAVNFLDVDDAPMALLAPRRLADNMEDDLDALEHVGTNAAGEPGNTHDRVWLTAGFLGGTPVCPGDPTNPNHDPTVEYPIIFSVDRGTYGSIGSAAQAQVLSGVEGASGDLFIAVTLPSGQPTNMLLIDEGQLGLMPHDDLDAVIVNLLIPIDDLVMRVEDAAWNFNPDGESEGYGFTLPLLGPGDAVVGFSVDLGSIGLIFTAVDFECRVDGTGVWPGASGVMEHAGDIFFSDLNPPPGGGGLDQGTGLPFGQNYLWFEELALGLDRGAWTFTPGGPSGNLDDVPDELNALDSDEFIEEEACCFLDDLDCINLMPTDCLAAGGVPQGPGTQCTAPDACCLPDGTCVNIDPLCCDDLGGIAQDPGTQCTQPEACCLSDAAGTCVMVDPLCCDDMGGVAQGFGTMCTVPEACCILDGLGTCTMVDPLCCDEQGGVPQGLGTSCSVTTVACCLQDGSGGCIDADPLCCDELGGIISGTSPVCLGDTNGNGEDDACECGWEPGDPHKMHFPQLPDEDGWDVNATQPVVLADDWRCSQSGWVKDIHFWGSWKNGTVGEIDHFVLSIHEDIPADQNPDGYSKPGTTLWEREIRSFIPTPIDPPTWEGWYDPYTGEVIYDDHMAYFQYDVCLPEADWFWQEAGTIYWLNISAVLVDDPTLAQWGWKSTEDHWNDDAVWALWDELIWIDLWEPPELLSDFFWVEVDVAGVVVVGGGSGWPYEPDGMWYYYPYTGWWNQWFYDHPYDPLGMKIIHIDLCVMQREPGGGQLIVAVNWSTGEWSLEGNPPGEPRIPPLPELVGENEELYIGRAILLDVPVYETMECYPLDFEIWDYNPEWVSIDVMGWNFVIPDGFIVHQCTGSLDLAFVITGGEMEPPGACCYTADLTQCIVTTQNDCEVNLGGVYEGDGTVCGGMEACCLTDGTCIDADALCCVNELGGNPQGPGTVCTVQEACCLTDGTCIMVDPLCCDEQGGVAQGAGTSCEGMEACCLPIGKGTGCVDADALCCRNVVGGTPQGPGTACSPDEACCLTSGACVNIDPLCCVSELNGQPQGPGTACTQPEACCLPGGVCTDVDPLCCDDIGGIAQGAGTACTTPEACCLTDGTCIMVDPLCCDEEGGVAQGAGTVCTAPEACCLTDGTCIMVDPLCCDEQGGLAQGAGTACTQVEACCLWDGTCIMVDPLCCDEQGGVPQGLGTQCTAVETCCLKDGSCINVDPLCCDEMGGSHSPTGVPLCLGDANGDGLDDACEPEGMKWVRMPDLMETGIDVNATVDPWEMWPLVLADDFWCDETGQIIEVRVWGSWWGDYLPMGDAGNVAFTLSFHTDFPGPPSEPLDPIWWWTFEPGEFYYERYHEAPEGWLNPPEDYYPFDHFGVWLYTFPMPADFPFIQEEGNIYWLDVQAMPFEEAYFGWKTTPVWLHWMDDAVWALGEEPIPPEPGIWTPLIYPPGHPWFPETLDLAFMLIQEPGAPVKRPLAEDCSTIAPGTRCIAIDPPGEVPCVDDEDCAEESHCVLAPADQPGLGNVCYAPKMRYISIARNPEQAPDTARRVKLDDGTVLGWVGPPSFETPAQEPAGLWVANVVGAPHYETVWPDVVHVFCCPIAHASLSDVTEQHCNPNPIAGENCVHHSYHIQATTDGVVYSEVLELKTNTTWGDTVTSGPGGLCMPPDGVPGLADIMAAINTFQGTYVAPITWVDIGPSNSDDCPERYVGLTDIMACIGGFQGEPYPGLGPKNCP